MLVRGMIKVRIKLKEEYKMSDGFWDSEKDKADILEREITQYCNNNNINCPVFEENARSWELKEIFEKLKSKNN